jgi:hypothetical protein
MILGSVFFLSSMFLSHQLSRLKRKLHQTIKEKEQLVREEEDSLSLQNQNQDWIIILRNEISSRSNWKQICSEMKGNEKCEIKVINNLAQSNSVFCWIGFDGTLHHYRRVNDRSIHDGSVPNFIVEFATVYHAFVCYTPQAGSENVKSCDQLNPNVCFSVFVC